MEKIPVISAMVVGCRCEVLSSSSHPSWLKRWRLGLGLGWEGREMTTPAAVDSKPWKALRMPGAGKMKVFTVWGNRNRSTPGTYRQLLAQTLKKAKDVHCTWQPQEVWLCEREVLDWQGGFSVLAWRCVNKNLQGPTLCQMRTIPLTARAAWSRRSSSQCPKSMVVFHG